MTKFIMSTVRKSQHPSMMMQIHHQNMSFMKPHRPSSSTSMMRINNNNNNHHPTITQQSNKRSLSTAYEQQAEEKSKSDRMTKILIDVIDAKPRKPSQPSPEEAERRYNIGRNYNIGTFQKHNELMHDLACKIKLKNHAIDMLPRKNVGKFGYLKEKALEIDTSDDAMPPYHRPIPFDTPPIPDFDPSIFMNEEEE